MPANSFTQPSATFTCSDCNNEHKVATAVLICDSVNVMKSPHPLTLHLFLTNLLCSSHSSLVQGFPTLCFVHLLLSIPSALSISGRFPNLQCSTSASQKAAGLPHSIQVPFSATYVFLFTEHLNFNRASPCAVRLMLTNVIILEAADSSQSVDSTPTSSLFHAPFRG